MYSYNSQNYWIQHKIQPHLDFMLYSLWYVAIVSLRIAACNGYKSESLSYGIRKNIPRKKC